jgi:hypothetical protein
VVIEQRRALWRTFQFRDPTDRTAKLDDGFVELARVHKRQALVIHRVDHFRVSGSSGSSIVPGVLIRLHPFALGRVGVADRRAGAISACSRRRTR